MQIIKLLNQLGYKTVDKSYYEHINKWKNWYMGKVEGFHDYSLFNGVKVLNKEKHTLNMAKTVVEDWTNYIFNKDTKIQSDSDTKTNVLIDFMKRVKFNTNISEVIESAFAMGTGAVTIIETEKGVDFNYIKDANMIFPITWDNGEIIDVCFAGYKHITGVKCLYLNIHRLVGEVWEIENLFYQLDDNGNIKERIVLDSVQEVYTSNVKRYAVFSPNVMNNIDAHCPLGLSVYANGIDALMGIDTVYDSYINEFVLGKKRIMISTDLLQVTRHFETVDGKPVEKKVPVFDSNDVAFYALPGDVTGEQKIKEIDMKLRVAEHKEAIQDMLNMLSVKIGMGTKHYSFVGGTVTATEVKSTTDTLYNSMLKHETALEPFIVDLLQNAMSIMGYDIKVFIEFDDSVIRDSNQDLLNLLQLLQNEVIDRAEVLAYWKGCDRQVALKQL
ncbi:MAG: phage portal protein, partial [Peptostreptococcaceae bacterium]